MVTEKKNFEAAPPGWDENPGRVRLAGEVAEAGFGDLDECSASEMQKVGADGIKRRFSVFLVTDRKQ